jgi:hypothetical protein
VTLARERQVIEPENLFPPVGRHGDLSSTRPIQMLEQQTIDGRLPPILTARAPGRDGYTIAPAVS